MPTPKPQDSPAPSGFPGARPVAKATETHRPEATPPPSSTAASIDTAGPWTRPPKPARERLVPRPLPWSRLAGQTSPQRQGDPSWLRSGRTLARLVTTDAFPQDFEQALASCQRPVTTGRRVGIIGVDGGTGASTIAAALGLFFARHRRDSVAVVDLFDATSGLNQRLCAKENPESWSTLTSPSAPPARDRDGALDGFATPDLGNLYRLTRSPRERPATLENLADLFRLLSRTCAISLLEAPLQSVAIAPEAFANLHAVVVVGRATPAGAQNAERALTSLQELVPTVPLLPVSVDTGSSLPADRAEAQRILTLQQKKRAGGATPHLLSSDRHLAPGTVISFDLIGEQRRLQLARIGAAALELSLDGSPA